MRHYCLDWPDLPARAFQRAPGKNRPATLEGGGKGGGGSAPSYPDPNTVAQATTATNTATAAYNKALNLNNYSNPFGSQQTTQIGTDPTTGAPIYNTSISANPQLTAQMNGLFGQTAQSGQTLQNASNGINGSIGGLNNSVGGVNGSIGGVNGSIAGTGNALNGLMGIPGQYNGLNQSMAGIGTQFAGLQNQLSPAQAAQAQTQGQDAAYKAQTQYLDPQFSQQKESLDAQLANQGLTPGSEAYNNAMTNFGNTKQNAYSNAANQAVMTGSQIGTQNLQNQISGINTQAGLLGSQMGVMQNQGNNIAQEGNAYLQQGGLYGQQANMYGQQANMYGQQAGMYGQQAGMYGQQAGMSQLPYSNLQTIAGMIPGYSGTSQSAASPADIAGLYNNQYQSKLAGYNAQQSSSNNMMSGLFGLGSSAMMGYMMSDRRAKRDIRRIGTWANGLGVYTYRYMWEKGARHLGFMADEVRRIAPAAVVRFADGYDRVSYVLAIR